jgi:hypothetical protein
MQPQPQYDKLTELDRAFPPPIKVRPLETL